MEGNLPQCPLNLHASIMLGSRRVEAERIIYLFRLFECLGTCVIWGYNDGSHQSRLAIRQHTSSVRFGKCFQAACPLEYLGFWILINSRAPYFLGHLLAFSHFGVSLPTLHLYRRCICHGSCFSPSSSTAVFATDHCSSPSSSLALNMLSMDFFPT